MIKTLRPYFKRSHRSFREHLAAHATGGGPWTLPLLCAAYGFPKGTAPGTTKPLAIVECGGGFVLADLQAFFASIGQPTPLVTWVKVDVDNSPGGDADVEVALDIEVQGAVYFYCTGKVPSEIRVYGASDITSGVAKATADGCCVTSISWGAPEASWGPSGLDGMQAVAVLAVAGGNDVFAASGDNDADDGTGTISVDCPASCPSIVGCGGTTKTATSEEVWDNSPVNTPNGEGTGGGFSAHFPVQSFQVGAPAPPAGLGRMVPDVAANADPNTGYEIVQGGSAQVVGGTSAVAPLLSGLCAAIGGKGALLAFWKNPGAFNDITQGTNGHYSAAAGPDPCSGLGTPIGAKVAAIFAGSAPAPSPTPPAPPAPPPPSGPPTLAKAQAAVQAALAKHGFLITTKNAVTVADAALAALPGWPKA
ncbi:MAG TPA: S53 family peptidase [Gemmatimonadales bacterium]|nr:S53 family peptidase [Gemmatimonadales bacterium]